MTNRGPAAFLLALMSGFSLCCSRGSSAVDAEGAAPVVAPASMRAHVRVVAVTGGELPIYRRALGIVVAPRQATARVSSRIAGVVASVEVVDGQEVTAGAVLARLDAPATTEALARANAAVASAEAELHRATEGGLDGMQAEVDLAAAQADVLARQTGQEASRQEALLAEKLTSDKAATEARQAAEAAERASRAALEKARVFRNSGRAAELARLRAAFDQARAEKRTADLDVDATVIRSPSAGRVCHVEAMVGRLIDRGAAVVDVIGTAATAVRVGLAPRDVVGVAVGGVVKVPQASASSLPGLVTSIGGATDPDTGLVPIEASLVAASGATLPRIGESVVVEIAVGPPARGLVVPISALSVTEDQVTVVTVDSNSTAHVTPVRILARTAEAAIVEGEGLREGADVVVDGNYNLPDAAHVVAERAP